MKDALKFYDKPQEITYLKIEPYVDDNQRKQNYDIVLFTDSGGLRYSNLSIEEIVFALHNFANGKKIVPDVELTSRQPLFVEMAENKNTFTVQWFKRSVTDLLNKTPLDWSTEIRFSFLKSDVEGGEEAFRFLYQKFQSLKNYFQDEKVYTEYCDRLFGSLPSLGVETERQQAIIALMD